MKTIGDSLGKIFEDGKLIGGLRVKEMWDISKAPDGREIRLLNYGIIGYAVSHATDLVKYDPFYETKEEYERDVEPIARMVHDMRNEGLRFENYPYEVKALLYRRARRRMRRMAYNNPPPHETKVAFKKIDQEALRQKYEAQLAEKNEARRKMDLEAESEREAEWMPPAEQMVG